MGKKSDRSSKNRPAPVPVRAEEPSAFSWVLLSGLGAWAAWVCRAYFAERGFDPGVTYLLQVPFALFLQTPLTLFWEYAQTVLLAAGFFWIAFHIGDALIRGPFRLEIEEPILAVVYSIGLGLLADFLLLLALGFSHLLYPGLLRAIYGVLLAGAAFRHFRLGYQWKPSGMISAFGGFSLEDKALVLLTGLFLALYAVMVFTPELFYDALVYHLSIPKYYLLHHGISKMEFLAFSTFPQAIHLIWAWALAMQARGEMLVKALHYGMAAFTVLGIYGFCKSQSNRTAGLLAGLFYYSAHYIAMNSWSCGNDAANSFIEFLSITAMASWCLKRDTGWWVLSALFAGFSLSAKYTSLYGVAATGAVWAFIQIREWFESRSAAPAETPAPSLAPALGRTAVWCAIVFALLSPWLIKNAVWVGNPIHPFFYRQLGDQNINVSRTMTDKAVIPGTVLNFQQWSFERLLTAPWWLTMSGNDSVRGIGPVFLIFLPLLLFIGLMPKGLRICLAVFGVSAALWYVADPLIRYLTTLPALAMALGWAVAYLAGRFSRPLRASVLFFAGLMVLSNWGYLFAIIQFNFRPWGVLTGQESRDQFLTYSRGSYPNPSYGMFKYINENLPADGTKVLFLAENKAYYIERDFLHSSVEWNDEPLIRWLKESPAPDDLYAKLRAQGVTHLLVNYREAIRDIGFKVFSWKEKDVQTFDAFWKQHVRLVAFQEGAYLYRIVGPDDPQAREAAPLDLLAELEHRGWTMQNFIQIQAMNQQWDQAIDEVQSLVRMGSPLFGYLASLHLRRNKEGDADQALALYDQATRVDSKNPDLYFQIAVLLARKGDRENAARASQIAVQLDPNNPYYRQLYQNLTTGKPGALR